MVDPARREMIRAVLEDLVSIAQTDEGRWLLQFRGLPGARQYRLLYRLLDRFVPRAGAVLDWGVANGHFSYALRRLGYDTTGYSLEALTFAPLVGDPGYRFRQGNPCDPITLPFPDGSFDCIVSVGVLEHVGEFGGSPAGSLREIRRVLRPGGIFLCYHLPNRLSAVETIASLIPGKYRHSLRFTARDIELLVAGAGLGLRHIRRYGLLPRNVWGRLPRSVRCSRPLALVVDTVDAVAERLLNPFCQNYAFVAEAKPEPGIGIAES